VEFFGDGALCGLAVGKGEGGLGDVAEREIQGLMDVS
jgi:hypothetical protein